MNEMSTCFFDLQFLLLFKGFLTKTLIVRSPFNFTPIADIVGGSYDTDFLVDVIGLLTGVGCVRKITSQNGTTSKLNVIEFEVDGHKIQCSLFGAYVDVLNVSLELEMSRMLLSFSSLQRLKLFKFNLSMSFCSIPLRSTLHALKDATNEQLNVVLGTVKRILNPCNKHVSRVFPMFCIKVAGAGGLPPQIADMVEKTWLFKVETKPSFNPRFEQSFRVRKICTEEAIINKFKVKWDKEDATFIKNSNVSYFLRGVCLLSFIH
ncbi:replication protein A 70 kDa DNA-binding subunit E [Trifolium repens]|nr:replication protein A 70 kDa DNA-binding subunit E [Trifolium repens]